MKSVNLTRETAARRAELLDVNSYTVHLILPPNGERFLSRTVIDVACHEPGATTFLDLRGAEILQATLNGRTLDVAAYNNHRSDGGETGHDGLKLPNLEESNEIVVEAWCTYSTTGEGLHRAVDAADGTVYLYSQAEPADAKRIFACFDQPDLKAPIALTVSAPERWELIGNSSIVETTPTTPAEAIYVGSVENPVTHTFETTKPLPPYLFAICAGPYSKWSDSYSWTGDDGTEITIPLNLYCRETLAEYFDPERIFELTKGGFDYYHNTFGVPYGFNGSYDQVFVPDFNFGAMENVGCVVYREDYVFRSQATAGKYERRADTVLHEMAHMWFGNLVTMKWWDDLWLNESFASWASVMAQLGSTNYQEAWTTFTSTQKNWAYRQDDLPSTHPIAAKMDDLQEMEANFDGITYAKGCSVLKQLVAYAGLEQFLKGLHDYLVEHSYSNATFDDLLKAVSAYTDKDFAAWAEKWLTTTGRNDIGVDVEVGDDGTYHSVSVYQTGAKPGAGELRPHRLGVGLYRFQDDELVRTDYAEVELDGERAEIPELVGKPAADLVLPNDKDLTYCQLQLDDRSTETVLHHIEKMPDSLARTLAWGVLEERTMHAKLPASQLVETLIRALPAESALPVAEHLMARGVQLLRRFVDPAWAEAEGWDRYAHMLLAIAREPQHGRDQQLIAMNALCACALPQEIVELLERGLDEGLSAIGVESLELDTDLRWTMMAALAAHGAVTQEDIDAALEEDSTSMGVRRAHTASAALPSAENKERVWELLLSSGEDAPSNWTLVALLDGFVWAGQDELLQPYVARYGAEMPGLWTRRTGEIATTFTQRAFPMWGAVDEVESVMEQMLAEKSDLPAGAQRYVKEGLFDIRRAAKARELDSELARLDG